MGWEGAISILSLLVSLATSAGPGPDPGPAATASAAMASAEGGAGFEQAPDFDVATAYGWHRFSELHRESPVLMVFEPDEITLAALESASAALQERGVEIVAVTRGEDGLNWALVEKLGLRYRLFSDPSGHLAELFGLTNAAMADPVPAWCLIDRGGKILDLRRGIETQELTAAVESRLPARAMAAGDAMR